MPSFLSPYLGQYYMQFSIVGTNLVQFLAVALLFCVPLHHKQHFALRMTVSLLLGALIWAVATWIRTD